MISLRTRLAAAGLCWVLLGPPILRASGKNKPDEEEKLQERLARTSNPVKQARLEIRLARLKLNQAVVAYNHQNFEQGQSLLKSYLQEVNRCWKTLQDSGRTASHHPRIFKDLDISLREDGRTLDDLHRRVPYPDNGFIEQIEASRAAIRKQVLDALFPIMRGPKSGKVPSRKGNLASRQAASS